MQIMIAKWAPQEPITNCGLDLLVLKDATMDIGKVERAI